MTDAPAYGADFVSPQGLYTLDANGNIVGIALPVAPFSSSIRWIRQSDGGVLASLSDQAFGTAPNRSSNLQLLAQEPVDGGASVDARIQAVVSLPGYAGAPNYARTILEVAPGIYGVNAPHSDFLLQERLYATLAIGTMSGFISDANFRIYDFATFAIQWQNSSINPNPPWSNFGLPTGRFTPPGRGPFIAWHGHRGAPNGNSVGTYLTQNGSNVPLGHNTVVSFTTAPVNGDISSVGIDNTVFGDGWQWSGHCAGGVSPQVWWGVMGVPFDLIDTP